MWPVTWISARKWKEYLDAKSLRRARPHRESLLESLKNPDEAAHYLSACLEE
jgi:hypothetical protein